MSELLIKAYKLKELCELDDKNPRTIKNSKTYGKNYVAIKFEHGIAKAMNKAGITKKDYSVRYIKLKDLKEYFEKRTGKKLILLDKKDL